MYASLSSFSFSLLRSRDYLNRIARGLLSRDISLITVWFVTMPAPSDAHGVQLKQGFDHGFLGSGHDERALVNTTGGQSVLGYTEAPSWK